MPTLFISHNHNDKAIARRVARRIGVYGIQVWLDERELRIGDALGSAIESQIQTSDFLLVIATSSAANSVWVKREVSFARDCKPPKPICSLFVENLQTHYLFSENLGVDATDPHHFEGAVLKIAEAIVGIPLPQPGSKRLAADIEAIRREEPDLAPLIDGCLTGEGLSFTNLESVAQAPFHQLDFVLNALYDLASDDRRYRVAITAAYLFAQVGAGTYALERHVLAQAGSDGVLRTAVGGKMANPEFDEALNLLSICSPPDDQALAGFISENGHRLTASQRNCVVRLVTYPSRGPFGFASDAAFAAIRQFSDSRDLEIVWELWIREGKFDGIDKSDSRPYDLAYYLAEALKSGQSGWEQIINTFLRHVKGLARSTDRIKVDIAINHLIAAAERESPLLGEVSSQCSFALGAAEWDNWEDRMEMGIYVNSFVKAAIGDRNWMRALNEYKESWDAVQRFYKLRNGFHSKETE